MFALYLNPMHGGAEMRLPVARAETRAALEALLERETVPPYQDGPWQKVFRAGRPLEWYNLPLDPITDVGTLERWLAQAQRHWEREVLGLPEVPAPDGEGA